MKDTKDIVRKEVILARNGLPKEQHLTKGKIIKDKLLSLEQFKSAKIIMCYVDFRSEVNTREFMDEALKMGKSIGVPIVAKNNDAWELEVSEIKSIDELEKGTFGIMEPKVNSRRLINPQSVDLVVVPGIAFDVERHRIGYGMGFYDRFLTNVREDCLKVGICFEAQLQEKIPYEVHDILMDMIITEDRKI